MKWLLLIFLMIPILLIFIHGIIKPKESFLFGRRWQFQNDVEPSEFALDIYRFSCIVGIIATVIFSVVIILN